MRRSSDRRVDAATKTAGFDAVYAYTWFSPQFEQQKAANIIQRDAASKAGLDHLPSFGMGGIVDPGVARGQAGHPKKSTNGQRCGSAMSSCPRSRPIRWAGG